MFLSDAQQAYSNETSNCISAVHRLSIFRFVSQHCLHCYAAMRREAAGVGWRSLENISGISTFKLHFTRGFFGGGNFKRKMTCGLGVDH